MMDRQRIAVIGYGAIAQDVIAHLEAEWPAAPLAVFHRSTPAHESATHYGVASLEALLAWQPEVIVEAAGHQAVRAYVPTCLAQGRSVIVTSVGALHDEIVCAELLAQAQQGCGRLILPSGAIGGLDYIRACCFAQDVQITYESRKPVEAWTNELIALGYDPGKIDQPVQLFEGDAGEAAKLYPSNLNVAATLALAGIGLHKTRVMVCADPALNGNEHHIHVTSDHGTMRITLANTPSLRNPKSSRIVAKSVLATLKQYFSPCQFL